MRSDKLREEQPIVYKALYNALSQDKVSHAYLFTGPYGTPKKDAAILLAQSLFCEKGDVFACETCETCRRVEENHHMDFTILDGSVKSISKKDIDELQTKFEVTSAEEGKGQRVYILLNVENSSPSAMNSLLKFLEEPGKDTTAILTTDNINRLLPTIISRCTMIPFVQMPASYYYREALKQGVEEETAYFLSHLVKDTEGMKEKAEGKAYTNALAMFRQFLNENGPLSELLVDYDISYHLPEKSENQNMIFWFLSLVDLYAHDVILQHSEGPAWYRNAVAKKKDNIYRYGSLITGISELKDRCNKYNDLSLLMAQVFQRLEVFCHG